MNRNELIEQLKTGPVTITFTKINGSERIMHCTLNDAFISSDDRMSTMAGHEPKKQVNEKVLAVWDIENNGWRSFRIDSVTNIKTGV